MRLSVCWVLITSNDGACLRKLLVVTVGRPCCNCTLGKRATPWLPAPARMRRRRTQSWRAGGATGSRGRTRGKQPARRTPGRPTAPSRAARGRSGRSAAARGPGRTPRAGRPGTAAIKRVCGCARARACGWDCVALWRAPNGRSQRGRAHG